MDERNDHDILVCLEVKIKELQQQFSNHLMHHWAVTIALITISMGTTASLLVALLTR